MNKSDPQNEDKVGDTSSIVNQYTDNDNSLSKIDINKTIEISFADIDNFIKPQNQSIRAKVFKKKIQFEEADFERSLTERNEILVKDVV